MINKATKDKWFQQIKADYPHLHDDMIDTILNLYDTDQKWIHEKIKELKKDHSGSLEIKRGLTIQELERLNKIGEEQKAEIEKSFSFGVISECSS